MKSLGTGVTKALTQLNLGITEGERVEMHSAVRHEHQTIIFLKKSKPIFRTRFLGNQKKLYMLAYFLKAGIG